MRLLYIAPEVAPFAKTGGLADVLGALPRQMHRSGHSVRVFLPAYSQMDQRKYRLHPVPGLGPIELPLGPHRIQVAFARALMPGSNFEVNFVYCPEAYSRSSIYTSEGDEHLRFLVLSYAALEACKRLRFAPHVVHVHDWQTAMVPLALKTIYARDPVLGRARSLLTIHNLQYQGMFPSGVVGDTGLARSAHLFHQDHLREGRLSFLLHGVLYADGITTVSPTYSREIQTPEHGAGLDSFLRGRSSTVVGILNGVDYDEWSPERDRLIPHRYDRDDLSGKELDKQALLSTLGLEYQAGTPVIGSISRLVGQKGLDLLVGVLPHLLRRHGFQFVLLGSGERRLEEAYTQLQQTFPRQVCFYRGFSNELAHLIEAGADMFVMPSRYEPCGLNQLYSLRYGTVPIVHKTGGLADTVQLWNPTTGEGTGFPFEQFDAAGLVWGIEAALRAYRQPESWQRLMHNGMTQDFSWGVQAKRYEALYSRLLRS
ncbi:MAG: glycogen synthase [Myxococcales bacterium]|nr:glycogen synthase [Myxococcales bacterium]